MAEDEATPKPKVGQGDFYVILGGREYVLTPTIAAARQISRQCGGVRTAIDAVFRWDFETIILAMTAALGEKQVKEIGDLPTVIWESGLTDSTGDIVGKLIDYLGSLGRGGRPLSAMPPKEDPPKLQ